MPRSMDGEWDAAAAAALAPYAWRGLTDRMLARMVVGAVDQHSVLRFLTSVPGGCAGEISPVEPADAGDERVRALVRALHGGQWRAWSLGRLCAHLLGALGDWHASRESVDPDPRRLLEGH